MNNMLTLQPGRRSGKVEIPLSKSHLHRLLISDFLAGGNGRIALPPSCQEDLIATRNCLAALKENNLQNQTVLLNCQESGSTLRFLLPVAMTAASNVTFQASGRLPQRPIQPFLDLLFQHGISLTNKTAEFPLHLTGRLEPGIYRVAGNISSQIITGLLFALPILPSDSTIIFTTPLESSGYVEMTLQVLQEYGIVIEISDNGFNIPGGQHYQCLRQITPEADWSSAAFWLVMNHLGSNIETGALPTNSKQPDQAIVQLLKQIGGTIDVKQCPDIFPILTIAAAAHNGNTVFHGIRRLKFKESDRVAAMAEVLKRFGVDTESHEDCFHINGTERKFKGNIVIPTFNDHRIAMSAAVATTLANGPVTIENPDCVAKSYPDFFSQFNKTEIILPAFS